MTIQTTSMLLFLVPLAFLLGWAMRGDKIYSTMFANYAAMMPEIGGKK